MRLAGVAKAGFYPAHPDAVQIALARLTLADRTAISPCLDPCSGGGAALLQIAQGLNVPTECVYGIELDEGRGAAMRERLTSAGVPFENVLAPASFEGCRATHHSFSFIWCNPPYDDEMGGGRRCEYSFLQRCTAWLRPHGIIAFVVPEYQTRHADIKHQLATWYTNVSFRAFPESVRKYDEVIVLAERRRSAAGEGDVKRLEWQSACTDYVIPPGDKPATFMKVEYTPKELLSAMQRSPLRRLLEPPAEQPLPSPPLALGTGHIALLLAAGHLDGVVRPDGEAPHVVRGVASKLKYLSHSEEKENADGSTTSIEKWSEKIILTVRAVDGTGDIKTFSQE